MFKTLPFHPIGLSLIFTHTGPSGTPTPPLHPPSSQLSLCSEENWPFLHLQRDLPLLALDVAVSLEPELLLAVFALKTAS